MSTKSNIAASGDPRLTAVSSFTETKHHVVPNELRPDRFVLHPGFTVCIIGASQGIGEHIAYAYAKARVTNLVLSARTESDLAKVADCIKRTYHDVDVITVPCDIASATSVENLANLVRSTYGRLDVLIPNAAYPGPVTLKIADGRPEWVQQAFDVNTIGTYHAAHYFVPLLLESEDGAKAFLAIGSLAGCIRRGIIANTGYTISKMAQIRFVEYLNEQYGDQGLLALAVHPGAVMTDSAKGNTPDDFMPYLIDDVGLCGAVCVWLSTQVKEIGWLSGRLISANWDMNELFSKREMIVQRDLLKFAMAVD